MMTSIYDAMLSFSKIFKLLKLFKLFGVICELLFPLVTHKLTFALFRNLYSDKTQISLVVLLNYLIKCNYRLHKTIRSHMHILLMGLEFAFFKFFENDFCT